jgi:hypothetical protein
MTATVPIIRIGKNASSIDMQMDYSTQVTKLFPRGAGSAPSELRFDNPNWAPYYPKLELVTTDSVFAYFRIPGDYTQYQGYRGEDTAIGGGSYMFVGRGTYEVYNAWPQSPYNEYGYPHLLVGESGSGMGFLIDFPDPFRLYEIGLWLGHLQYWEENTRTIDTPRFLVGLYNATQVGSDSGSDFPAWGPLVWNIANLDMLPAYSHLTSDVYNHIDYYTFPMQTAAFAAGRYAIVIYPYPNSDGWGKGAGNVSDRLLWANTGTDLVALHDNRSVLTSSGLSQLSWNAAYSSDAAAINSGYYFKRPGANRVFCVGGDPGYKNWAVVWQQSAMYKTPEQPGRYVKCPVDHYDPAYDYYMFYYLSPNLTAWDQLDEHGIIEGTMKNDSIVSADALLNVGTQYLKSISQPVITLSLSISDLYDLDPSRNWTEELKLGGQVTVMDDVLGINTRCTITKINKPNLNHPHEINIQLDNVHMNAQKMLANLSNKQLTAPKYAGGQTVSTPFSVSTQADTGNAAELYFDIREVSDLVHSVKLSVVPSPLQVASSSGVTTGDKTAQTYAVKIDGYYIES